MPFFLPGLIISAIVGIGGFLILTFLAIEITPAVAFIVSSLITGLSVTVFNNNVPGDADTDADADTEDKDNEEQSDDFTTLYVGNLPYRVNEQAVKTHFMEITNVKSVRLLRDRKTGKRKGFGFIEVPSNETDKVIQKFNDSEFEDRTLKVRIAKDRARDE